MSPIGAALAHWWEMDGQQRLRRRDRSALDAVHASWEAFAPGLTDGTLSTPSEVNARQRDAAEWVLAAMAPANAEVDQATARPKAVRGCQIDPSQSVTLLRRQRKVSTRRSANRCVALTQATADFLQEPERDPGNRGEEMRVSVE